MLKVNYILGFIPSAGSQRADTSPHSSTAGRLYHHWDKGSYKQGIKRGSQGHCIHWV